jgi:hypothetical protein
MQKNEITLAKVLWSTEGTVETLSHNKVTKRNVWKISAKKQFRLRAVHHVHSELLPFWGLSGLIIKYKEIM